MKAIFSEALLTELHDTVKGVYIEALEQARRDSAITKEFLTFEEAADYINASKATLTKWLEYGLNVYQIGNKRYIKKSELHEFIERHQL